MSKRDISHIFSHFFLTHVGKNARGSKNTFSKSKQFMRRPKKVDTDVAMNRNLERIFFFIIMLNLVPCNRWYWNTCI
jgi:hypothetical protein